MSQSTTNPPLLPKILLPPLLTTTTMCLYTEDQVGFLQSLGEVFEQALHDDEADRFMQELYTLWLRDWPEPPADVQHRKNSLRRAMLVVSYERLLDLTFIDQGITPQFTPVMPDVASTTASTTGMQPSLAGSTGTTEGSNTAMNQ
ncbi:uncharacterized protein ARMOST_19921 [Armillaria ostoyae]|uniref:Uncharacterized protein n=1 Tax=Armillaria ostoyae TaxID=47428 RepID=A0A284S5W4_ARMOS|nr:uncharacterized protein ARMOST_19921 [Armillaria ostoyae]